MTRGWLAVLAMTGALISGLNAHAAEFTEMVRDLNSLQNRMVTGDEKARATVARQFDLIEQTIMTLEPQTWAEEKNVRAAAIYLLCGGAPASLREIHDAGFAPDELSSLLEAALRYAEGVDDAAATLMDFDARRFPPMLGGHLALVQGGSVLGVDNARAISLLDLARLLMPASLVEEAALRREIKAVDPQREGDKLSMLATRYVDKYLASPYSQNFWTEMRMIVSSSVMKEQPGLLAKFEPAIDKASPHERTDMYLMFSRRALLDGHLDEATAKLDKAERSAENPDMRKRIAAYRAVIKSLSSVETTSATDLREIDTGGLAREDLEMLRIVSSVLARLERPAEIKRTPYGAKTPEADVPSTDEPAIIASARAALLKSDELLKSRVGQ